MCGRYALHTHPQVVALTFGLATPPEFAPRFNIAPLSEVLIVRAGTAGAPQAANARWGLLPRWAKDPKLAAKLSNARAETVAEKPSFRDAFRRRRCLVPASGFYEWRAEGGRKHPYYVRPAQGPLFAFAGIWERWEGPQGPLETCAIITTDANEVMQAIHDRMPVILAAADYARWLDCRPANDVAGLLRPADPGSIEAYRVAPKVNNSRSDGAELIEALT
jgi:putative SOS response-associated peptidase YedK